MITLLQMKSVADDLKLESRRAFLALSPAQRVALVLALGERDLDFFRAAQVPALGREAARRLLERQRQCGRIHSSCHSALFS